MVLPLDNPIHCPVLVGRQPQLAALKPLFEAAVRGRGWSVLVAGEAGVGKSRLLKEMGERARAQGLLTLQGNSFEQDRSLPYGPLRDLFSNLPADPQIDEGLRRLAEEAPELQRALPELGVRSGNLSSSVTEAEPDKRRIFQALTDFVAGVATSNPTLLIVEDLHWIDDESLEFLLYLARHIPTIPLVLLLSYRSDEQQPGLRRFLASLDRERLASELQLDRLGLAEVDAMLRAIFGLRRSTRAESLNIIYSLTDGNPFFIEEVLRSLIASGQLSPQATGSELRLTTAMRVPRSVQEAVQSRSSQLSTQARSILSAAAVAGRRFDFSLLQTITGTAEVELLQLVKQLVDAQLFVEETEDLYAFRHALTRQAVYSQLLSRERKQLHAQIVATIERLDSQVLEAYVSDLAYHCFEAEDWQKAAAYSQRAAEAAQHLYAPRAALDHFNRAIQAVQRLSIAPPADLFRGRGLVHETLGEFDSALADQLQALEAARAAGNLRGEWQALLDLGGLWAGSDYSRTGEYLQHALRLSNEIDDISVRARSLNRIGNWHLNNEEPAAARTCHEDALALFRQLGDVRGTAETLDFLGLTCLLGADYVQSRPYYGEAVRLYEALGDRLGVSSTLATMATGFLHIDTDSAVPGATIAQSLADAERSLQLAREIGWRSGEAFALGRRAIAIGNLGDYSAAFADHWEALRIAEGIEHRQWMSCSHIFLGAMYLLVLALPQADEHLDQALKLARELKSPYWINSATGLLASTYVQQNRLDRAEEILDAVQRPDTPARTRGQRQTWVARAELAMARHQPAVALEIAERLFAAAGTRTVYRPQLLAGKALAMLARPVEAEVALRQALQVARQEAAVYAVWPACFALGHLLSTASRREEAHQFFAEGRAIVERLAGQLMPDLADPFARSALAGIPAPSPVSARTAAKEAFGGLTQREREVAVLVARGETNRAVAEALVLSERTVESHIASILSKRGFSSRREIAAWAKENGLGAGDREESLSPYRPST